MASLKRLSRATVLTLGAFLTGAVAFGTAIGVVAARATYRSLSFGRQGPGFNPGPLQTIYPSVGAIVVFVGVLCCCLAMALPVLVVTARPWRDRE